MVTNKQLREAFLSAQMKYYFNKKFSPLPSNEVDVRIEEMLKYLNMAFHCNGGIPFSKEIDEVWHYWILETMEYKKLCEKLHGGLFLHHTSNDYAEYVDKDVKNNKINLTFGISILSSYVLNYGPFDRNRVRYWPLTIHIMNHLNWNVDELNEWLGSVSQLPDSKVNEVSINSSSG